MKEKAKEFFYIDQLINSNKAELQNPTHEKVAYHYLEQLQQDIEQAFKIKQDKNRLINEEIEIINKENLEMKQ